MNILYRINQSSTADSITNAKNVTRTINLDKDSRLLRVCPEGEEATNGLEFPSTENTNFGKVFVGVDTQGKRIYKDLKECFTSGVGITPVPTVIGNYSGLKFNTNLVGRDGIKVEQNGDATEIKFMSNNRSGLTGFSLTKFAGEDWHLYNPTLAGDRNPDWVKNMKPSLINIEENSTTKTYSFVAPMDGVWNVVYNFNDVWNSIRPITGLSTYTPADFNRDFEVRVDIIKNQVDVTGVDNVYRLEVDANVTQYQNVVLGEASSFIVTRENNIGGSSIYVYAMFLNDKFETIGADAYAQFGEGQYGSSYFHRTLVEFANGVSRVDGSYIINQTVPEAKYVVWSFSKLEIDTKTIAPSGDGSVISLAHQSVRYMENGSVVDNTFDRSFWLMLEKGDTVRAQCIFEDGELAPICEASFTGLYMLPGITIGDTATEALQLYDYIVYEAEQWQEAMENPAVETVFVVNPITVPTTTIAYTGHKQIFGQQLTINQPITIGATGVNNSVKIINDVELSSGTALGITCRNVYFRKLISLTAGTKTITVPSGDVCKFEQKVATQGPITGGETSYWNNTAGAGFDNLVPVDHASPDPTYGVGTSTRYGHNKLYDDLNNQNVDGAPTQNAVVVGLALKAPLTHVTSDFANTDNYGHVKFFDGSYDMIPPTSELLGLTASAEQIVYWLKAYSASKNSAEFTGNAPVWDGIPLDNDDYSNKLPTTKFVKDYAASKNSAEFTGNAPVWDGIPLNYSDNSTKLSTTKFVKDVTSIRPVEISENDFTEATIVAKDTAFVNLEENFWIHCSANSQTGPRKFLNLNVDNMRIGVCYSLYAGLYTQLVCVTDIGNIVKWYHGNSTIYVGNTFYFSHPGTDDDGQRHDVKLVKTTVPGGFAIFIMGY